jgi:molecular chaperone GrpE
VTSPGARPEAPEEAEVGAERETDAAVAAVLDDFRAWLSEALVEAPADEGEPGTPGAPPVDLHTLLGHFVALRQEVNLQTRAARAQQEQGDKALGQLEQALAALTQARSQQQQQQGQEERLRPLLTTLIDLHDALSLAGREMKRVEDTVLPQLEQVVAALEQPAPERAPSRPSPAAAPAPASTQQPSSLWSRWFGRRAPADGGAEVRAAVERLEAAARALEEEAELLRSARLEREAAARGEKASEGRSACGRVSQALAALVTGYTMSLQRVERALRQHGLEPIQAVGQIYDPERMEALEAVADSDRAPGEVVQEVRRGYLWNGRVFRYAQVRVARG